MHLILAYGGGNDLGRAYCLWLLVQNLGWTASVFAHDPSWMPLRGSGMEVQPWECLTQQQISEADAIIVYQPLPETLGSVLRLTEGKSVPLLVDVDDPHWEGRYGFSALERLRVIAGKVRRGKSPLPPYRARGAAKSLPLIGASPFAEPGRRKDAIIPHVREATAITDLPDSDMLRIAFVGSPRPYKGLELLRSAAKMVKGVELVITAERPSDAMPHEQWVGTTSLDEGRILLSECHMTAVLQEESRWTRVQFPVKVVDGMIAGRVVLATDVAPIRWALNSTGILVPPRSPELLVSAIQHARDNRANLRYIAVAARSEAESRFTPSVVAPVFAEVVQRAVQGRGAPDFRS